MKRHIQTRANARSLDYDWLGEQPERRWWERYKSYTFFEHRTLIVEGDGRGWLLYASAIPSTRRDAVGTGIWHDVMLAGSVSDEPDRQEAIGMLGAALLCPDELGRALDAEFDEEFVARCLAEPGSLADEVADRLARAFAAMPGQDIDPEPMSQGEMAWGGAKSADGPLGLARRAAAFIAGRSTGMAALLNLVQPSELPMDLAGRGSAALLVEGSDKSWRSLPKATPVPVPGKGVNRRPLIITALVLVGLVAAGAVAYLAYRRLHPTR